MAIPDEIIFALERLPRWERSYVVGTLGDLVGWDEVEEGNACPPGPEGRRLIDEIEQLPADALRSLVKMAVRVAYLPKKILRLPLMQRPDCEDFASTPETARPVQAVAQPAQGTAPRVQEEVTATPPIQEVAPGAPKAAPPVREEVPAPEEAPPAQKAAPTAQKVVLPVQQVAQLAEEMAGLAKGMARLAQGMIMQPVQDVVQSVEGTTGTFPTSPSLDSISMPSPSEKFLEKFVIKHLLSVEDGLPSTTQVLLAGRWLELVERKMEFTVADLKNVIAYPLLNPESTLRSIVSKHPAVRELELLEGQTPKVYKITPAGRARILTTLALVPTAWVERERDFQVMSARG